MTPPRTWIGPAIRARRIALGLTQDDLALRVGASTAAVSRWESGKRMPGLDRLDALCRALDVPADYFRGVDRGDADR